MTRVWKYGQFYSKLPLGVNVYVHGALSQMDIPSRIYYVLVLGLKETMAITRIKLKVNE